MTESPMRVDWSKYFESASKLDRHGILRGPYVRRAFRLVPAAMAMVFVLGHLGACTWPTVNIYADCPPTEWSQELLNESRAIAEVDSENGSYEDCDSLGATEVYLAGEANAVRCARIEEQALARGWTIVEDSGECEFVMSREIDGRLAQLIVTKGGIDSGVYVRSGVPKAWSS